ncbi:MAG: hypothetical protein EPN98_08780 [Phenylobacterium sp.]|uniref:hypothetical protein n=1 Tax=Phenylobacterium sp. TaxID=1871053 RepID=UPI0012221705|nr:hypothetical protein [Phenylobacterium sp.]TAL34542.1 MAG: hypothetical protein EPN98_08780 [Phenylobacterium sp.]
MPHLHSNEAQPCDALFHGERLLVRTVRLLALTTPCHGLQAHFEAACGCAGEAAYRMLEAFVQQMALKGRRRVRLSIPADPRLTDDEALILDVFGCAQAGDFRSVDERLRGLLDVQAPFAMGAAACMVAETLAMNGLMLRPRPTPDQAIPCPGETIIFPMAAE